MSGYPEPSSNHLRRLLPAGMETDRDIQEDYPQAEAIRSQSSLLLPKRSHITPVACQHCQRKKSKCDGARPTCGACQKKGRTDCTYDLPRDQRRSVFMRQKLEEVEKDKDDLKDIITGICMTEDRDAMVEMARHLVNNGFENIAEVAKMVRNDLSIPETAPESLRRIGIRGTEHGGMISPQGEAMQSQIASSDQSSKSLYGGEYWPSFDDSYDQDLDLSRWPPPGNG